MKICIFTETYYPVMGGGETQAKLLAEGLVQHGTSVLVLTRRSDASLKKIEQYGDIKVYRLAPVGRGQLKKWGLLFSSIPALLRLRNQYELIFVSGYRIIGLTAVLIGKLLRKPVVLKADSQGEMSGEFFEAGLRKFGMAKSTFAFRLFLRIRNRILRKADAFSAISPAIAAEWKASGIPSEKVHIIPNSVDTSRFFPVDETQKRLLREKLDLPTDAMIGIYTGRLVSYKGLPLLLKVWNEIRHNVDQTLLILAGTGGLDIHNCEDELREYTKAHGMENHVMFTGAVQNVSEYLQASDLFVFPTENDAFPSSLVEAMACGLPVITTPVGAIKSIVVDGETGVLIQPSNFEQLFQALHVMLTDRAAAARLGGAASQAVQRHYSAEIIIEKYEELFQHVIHSTHPNLGTRPP
jgi:glycosyltransferase involved in cell wall biosynthesis